MNYNNRNNQHNCHLTCQLRRHFNNYQSNVVRLLIWLRIIRTKWMRLLKLSIKFDIFVCRRINTSINLFELSLYSTFLYLLFQKDVQWKLESNLRDFESKAYTNLLRNIQRQCVIALFKRVLFIKIFFHSIALYFVNRALTCFRFFTN